MLRTRIHRGHGRGTDTQASSIPNGTAGLGDQTDALKAELARLNAALRVVQQQRSPMLWNEIEGTVPDSLGTISDAVRAVTSDDKGFARALEFAVERFKGCAQGPLLAALDPEQLRALVAADLMPIPPPEARESYFAGDDMSYWTSGLGDRLLLEDLGRRFGRPLTADSRLLDFGSSSGRVLRHFANAMPRMRLFGVDLGRPSVEWVRQHLPPTLTVVHGTALPHLPFPDGFFDCIYAGSVFTHIADFEEAWLLELSRVLAPRGFAVLTFHPERTWTEMGSNPDHWCRRTFESGHHRLDPGAIEPVSMEVFQNPMPAERVVLTLTTWPVNNANVFHSHSWIRERWGRFFDIQLIVSRAHAEYQDAAVLTKRA
jgi:SAM-dependent methyltransferase